MTVYTTPAKINKALAKAGFKVEIVKGNGYFWFADDTTQIRSIFEWPRLSGSPNVIVEHVRSELQRIKGE